MPRVGQTHPPTGVVHSHSHKRAEEWGREEMKKKGAGEREELVN